jgi:hypothetical protein
MVTVAGGNKLDDLWFKTWSRLSRHGVVDMTIYFHVLKDKDEVRTFWKEGYFCGIHRVSYED